MSSEIEVVEKGRGRKGGEVETVVPEIMKNDVYTAATVGDLEKLQRLVEVKGFSVAEPDGGGYYALQWAALNNRTAVAQYIIEVRPFRFCEGFEIQRITVWVFKG